MTDHCPQIVSPIIFDITEISGNSSDRSEGAVVTLYCQPGYEILSSNIVRCTKNGTWVPPVKDCTAIPPPLLSETDIITIGSCVGGFLLICVIVIVSCVYYRKYRKRKGHDPATDDKASWTRSYDDRSDYDDREDYSTPKSKHGPPPTGYIPHHAKAGLQMNQFSPGLRYEPNSKPWFESFRIQPIPRPYLIRPPHPAYNGYTNSYHSSVNPTDQYNYYDNTGSWDMMMAELANYHGNDSVYDQYHRYDSNRDMARRPDPPKGAPRGPASQREYPYEIKKI